MSLVFPLACHSFSWLYFTIQSQCRSPSAVAVNSVIKRNQMQTVLEIHYRVLQKLNELPLRVNLCKGQVCWHFLVEEKTMSKYNHCTFYFIVYLFGSPVERMNQKWYSKKFFFSTVQLLRLRVKWLRLITPIHLKKNLKHTITRLPL